MVYFIAGAIVAFLVPTLTEKWQRNNKKKETGSLVINDIGAQLVQINEVETQILPSLKKSTGKTRTEVWMQSIRLFASIYSENRLISFLPQLPILPRECQRSVLSYYKMAEFFTNSICLGIDHRDKKQVIASWAAFSNIARNAGYNALADLYGLVMKDTNRVTTLRQEAENFRV